jgi:3-oxoacyl-[acyl-carrier protein] reductase
MKVLDGKVAIVTGASKGIGAAIATGLGEAGASVAVNYTSSRDGAERTVEAIRSRGGNAVALRGDVSKASDVVNLFAEADAAYGARDVLLTTPRCILSGRWNRSQKKHSVVTSTQMCSAFT